LPAEVKTQLAGAEETEKYTVFALQGFEPAEVTTIQTAYTAPKDSIKDRVILTKDQLSEIVKTLFDVGDTDRFSNKLQVIVGGCHAKIHMPEMIFTKVPPPASA